MFYIYPTSTSVAEGFANLIISIPFPTNSNTFCLHIVCPFYLHFRFCHVFLYLSTYSGIKLDRRDFFICRVLILENYSGKSNLADGSSYYIFKLVLCTLLMLVCRWIRAMILKFEMVQSACCYVSVSCLESNPNIEATSSIIYVKYFALSRSAHSTEADIISSCSFHSNNSDTLCSTIIVLFDFDSTTAVQL